VKRLLSILVTIILLVASCTAQAETFDFSGMSIDELHTLQNAIRNELLRRDLVAGDEILLFEKEGISLYLTGDHSDGMGGLRLSTKTINDTDKEINIYCELSVNGWDVGNVWSLEANPRKKSKGYIDISIKGADISTYEEVEEIEFRFTYWFKGGDHVKIDPITIQFPLAEQ